MGLIKLCWRNKWAKWETLAFLESLLRSRNRPSYSGPVYATFHSLHAPQIFWWRAFPQEPWLGVVLPTRQTRVSWFWRKDISHYRYILNLVSVSVSWEFDLCSWVLRNRPLRHLTKLSFITEGWCPNVLSLAKLCHKQPSWPFPERRVSAKHISKLPLWWLSRCKVTFRLGKSY